MPTVPANIWVSAASRYPSYSASRRSACLAVPEIDSREDAKLLSHSLPPRVGKHVLLATS